MNTEPSDRDEPLALPLLWASLARRADDPARITVAIVRDLFHQNRIVRGSMRLPSEEGFVHLARSMDVLWSTKERGTVFLEEKQDLHSRLRSALSELAAVLPPLIEITRTEDERPADIFVATLSSMVAFAPEAKSTNWRHYRRLFELLVPAIPVISDLQGRRAQRIQAETLPQCETGGPGKAPCGGS